ncbi:MAG: adenine phosphoribosyltransferase [Candidatus Omnitrophica bacterium]|nr:adenine phosphoribosyltransferase [Candidatus Omnitrophota bacterium]
MQTLTPVQELKSAIRDVPDFPKKGVIFKDITPLLSDGRLFNDAVGLLSRPYTASHVHKVVAVEARGFIFGAAIAARLEAGFIPVRKKGKLPHTRIKESYELEYGVDQLEIHQDAIVKGERVLLVDDLLATGGTCDAVIKLIRRLGGEIVGCTFLIELTFLNGRKRLKDYPVTSLITY